MIVFTLWRLGIAGLAWHYASTGVDETMSDESLSYLSNVGVSVGYLILALYPLVFLGRRHEPRTGWLRGSLTVMMLVVGFVWVPGMGEEPDGPHAVIPLLVLMDWLFVGRNQARARWWEPPTWTAFLLAYLFYHQSNDVTLYPEILGDDKIGTMVPLFLTGAIIMGYIIWGLAVLRIKVVTSGSSKPQEPQHHPQMPIAPPYPPPGYPANPPAPAPVPGNPGPYPGPPR